MGSVRLLVSLGIGLFAGVAMAEPAEKDCTPGGEVAAPVGALLEVASKIPTGACADASKLLGLCDAIRNKWDAPKDSDYIYKFELMVMNAACAKPTDSEDVIASKVQYMWNKLKDDTALTCDGPDFSIPRGNVLKYAIQLKSFDFIAEATETWKVNLNRIDPRDNRTVLDFVKDEYERYKGSIFENQMKQYYDYLRKNGAKHRIELK